MNSQTSGKKVLRKLRFIGFALVVIAILASLGVWQLQRADEKRAIVAALKERSTGKPVWVGETNLQLPTSEYRHAKAQGQLDSTHTVFLDNQIHEGQAGYHVLVPLRLADSKGAILINRGWIPRGLDRQQLPTVKAPDSPITVHGVLRRPPKAPFFLGDKKNLDTAGWPKRVQYVDLERLQTQLGYTLQPLILYLAPDEPYGFVRQWSVQSGTFGPQRNIAYAVQWFVMAAVAAIAFVILYRRRFSDSKQHNKGKG